MTVKGKTREAPQPGQRPVGWILLGIALAAGAFPGALLVTALPAPFGLSPLLWAASGLIGGGGLGVLGLANLSRTAERAWRARVPGVSAPELTRALLDGLRAHLPVESWGDPLGPWPEVLWIRGDRSLRIFWFRGPSRAPGVIWVSEGLVDGLSEADLSLLLAAAAVAIQAESVPSATVTAALLSRISEWVGPRWMCGLLGDETIALEGVAPVIRAVLFFPLLRLLERLLAEPTAAEAALRPDVFRPESRAALERVRAKMIAAGRPDLRLQAWAWAIPASQRFSGRPAKIVLSG